MCLKQFKKTDNRNLGVSLNCIDETELVHDDQGPTFNNGAFMVYESMKYLNRDVTVKRLHQNSLERRQNVLLISEQEILKLIPWLFISLNI